MPVRPVSQGSSRLLPWKAIRSCEVAQACQPTRAECDFSLQQGEGIAIDRRKGLRSGTAQVCAQHTLLIFSMAAAAPCWARAMTSAFICPGTAAGADLAAEVGAPLAA